MSSRVPMELLTVFEAIALERSASRAAVRLNLSQSAVSHALNRLRHLFGDPLFVRDATGLQPTTRARELSGRLLPLLAQVRHALEPAAFDPTNSVHEFRVILSEYSAALWLEELATRIVDAGPQLSVNAMVRTIRQGFSMLEIHEADFLIAEGATPEGFASTTLSEENSAMVLMSKTHPLARKPLGLADYAACHHIVVPIEATSAREGLVEQVLASRGLQRRRVVTVTHFSAALSIVARTNLVLIAPFPLANYSAEKHRLHATPLDLGELRFDSQLFWKPAFATRAADDWFRRLVTSLVKPRAETMRTRSSGKVRPV